MIELAVGAMVLVLTLFLGSIRQKASAASSGCFAPSDPPSAVVRTFLFADIVGFTALADRRGDREAARLAERFAWLALQSLTGEAELVKTMGDGVLIVAEHNADALRTAEELVRRTAQEPGLPPVAVGLHRGPAVPVGRDYIGAAVNVAARVAEQAAPSQILFTDAVTEPMGMSAEGPSALGWTELRGLRDAVLLYRMEPASASGAGDRQLPPA